MVFVLPVHGGRTMTITRNTAKAKRRLFPHHLPLARSGVSAGLVLSFAHALGEFGAPLMLAGNISVRTQTMPLAICEAVAAGEKRQAQILALILTAVSVTAIYLTNRLTRSQVYG